MYLQCALQLSLYVVQFWQVYIDIDIDLDVIGFILVSGLEDDIVQPI